MLEKIEAIEKALDNKSFLPALALALTLPDICGQIEYPNYIDKYGYRLVGKQYKKWFKEWVEIYYADDSRFEVNDKPKNPDITKEMCYSLRCQYLHSGNIKINDFGKDTDDEYIYKYHFNLYINASDRIGSRWCSNKLINGKILKDITVSLNVKELCENICNAARKYYTYKGNEVFKDNVINIIDIEYELNKNRNLYEI